MNPNMTHIALHVEQLDACVGFYRQYCQLRVIHERHKRGKRVIWMAEQGREHQFVMVLLGEGGRHQQGKQDFSHLGFAVDSKAEVDRIAAEADKEGLLVWPPIQEPYPVGYYCGLIDPNGNYVEFSYGQPLGPGSEDMPLLGH